eukprot:1598226-Prymnesium_polylepis.2
MTITYFHDPHALLLNAGSASVSPPLHLRSTSIARQLHQCVRVWIERPVGGASALRRGERCVDALAGEGEGGGR